jgi:hypothetical protein
MTLGINAASTGPTTSKEQPSLEQAANCTQSPPVQGTERVLALIGEASKPEHIVWPLIFHENTKESRTHNARMKQLVDERSHEHSPGICVCNIGDPASADKDFFVHGHPCRDHAVRWYHFFHCVRAQSEDYVVLMQQLDWCECKACMFYCKRFDDHINGVTRLGSKQRQFSRRGTLGTEKASTRQRRPMEVRNWWWRK